MPCPYTTLGVPRDADDAAIRQRYLACIRECSPEHHPERFASIRQAYESIATIADRAHHQLLESQNDESIEEIIKEISCRTNRSRPSLSKMIDVVSSHPTPKRR